jgi:hypothetical protein
METVNKNGHIPFKPGPPRTRTIAMAMYDTLPPAQRQIMQDAPYNLTLTAIISPFWLNEAIRRAKNEGILKTYGSDHPEYDPKLS